MLLGFTAIELYANPPVAALDPAPVLREFVQSSSKTPANSSASKANSHTGRGQRRGRPAGTSSQLHPDPQRYQEIQRALADRGYFKGEVNGQWGQDSIDALKHFQADQKLPDDGKINALTLVGLGLGRKHDGSAASSPGTSTAAGATPADPPPAPVSEPPSGTESGPPPSSHLQQ
jgi:hypothetical protein